MKHLKSPFRLFFLGAGLLACILAPMWLLIITGRLEFTGSLAPTIWHAHEMLFGYIGALLAGFLLTATVHWTGHKTVGPIGLAVLLALWFASRVLSMAEASFPGSVFVEPLFLAGVGFAIGRSIIAGKRWRNIAFPILMLVLAASDLTIHLASSGDIGASWLRASLWVAIDSIGLIILIFGGRIIPLFTKNALSLPGFRKKSLLDYAGLASVGALMLAHALSPPVAVEATVWALAGALTIARLYGWNGSKSIHKPLLFVLHFGWFFSGLGMLLISVSLFAPRIVHYTSAIHLFLIGGIGTLTLGMMARVTLGHTGRTKVASKPIAAAFVALVVAAIFRVIATLVDPSLYYDLLWVAAIAWAVGFLVFVLTYLPALLGPRVDGKPG